MQGHNHQNLGGFLLLKSTDTSLKLGPGDLAWGPTAYDTPCLGISDFGPDPYVHGPKHGFAMVCV
jgi:hypothetical protein